MLGGGATDLLGLSPYASLYAYRIASAFLAAILWGFVFARLAPSGRPGREVFALFLLIPMVGILGGSINPDAVFIPLCALVMLSSYDAIFQGRRIRTAAALLLALAFTKSAAALLVFPTLAGVVGIAWLGGRILRTGLRIHWPNAAILIVAVLVVFHVSFYHWSPAFPVDVFPERFQKSPLGYLQGLGVRSKPLFASFWLALGLPDSLAPWLVYWLILILLALNAAAAIWRLRELEDKGRLGFLLGFALLYGAGLVVGEYLNFAKTGYLLQGRYFLPVALGFLVAAAHPVRILRRAFLVGLVVFNLYAVQLSVMRFYDGHWSLLWRELPFRTAPALD